MTKLKLLIYSISAIAICLVFYSRAAAFDDSFLKGRAIQIAHFSEDDLVVEPRIIYSINSDKESVVDIINPKNKVVNLIDPRFSHIGISAVFEAPKYTIQDQSQTIYAYSFKRRVGDILKDGGVALAKEDIISPPGETPAGALSSSLIKITRVSVAEIEEFESVPYQTKKIEDSSLNKGVEKISSVGKNGRKRLTYQVRRENGVEVSRQLLSQEVTEKPQEQVLIIGTKPVITVRCKFNDTVAAACAKYGVDPNSICSLMMKESNGNPLSVNPDGYFGLFQYDLGFWESASRKAGYSGAEWSDQTAQIYTTAWCFANGQRSRWP
jgi:hypothetical protein